MNERNEAENKPGKTAAMQCDVHAAKSPFKTAILRAVLVCAIGGPKVPPMQSE